MVIQGVNIYLYTVICIGIKRVGGPTRVKHNEPSVVNIALNQTGNREV